ncbi:MAG: HAD hydrolase-like protein [Cyanophyceae cyanobacterium]
MVPSLTAPMEHEPLPLCLALDFDGVLCDGMREYFQTAWRAYCQVWLGHEIPPPATLEPTFARLRPVIETGWEMAVLLRVLLLGTSEESISRDWPTLRDRQVAADGLDPKELAAMTDGLRDDWIADDLDEWLGLHDFFPGAIARLQQILDSSLPCHIVTTKEERFVRKLLACKGVIFPAGQVFGKGVQRPKADTLRLLAPTDDGRGLWFVEDMLSTLHKVQKRPDLQGVELFLANWGYNRPEDRRVAMGDRDRLHCLSLDQFCGPFSRWRSRRDH